MPVKAIARSPIGGMIAPKWLPGASDRILTHPHRKRSRFGLTSGIEENIKKRTNGNGQTLEVKVMDTFADRMERQWAGRGSPP